MALVPFPGQPPQQSSSAEALETTDSKGGLDPSWPDPPADDTDPDADEDVAGRMTFLEHLDELRKRITHAVIGLFAGFLIAFAVVDQIQRLVFARLAADVPGHNLIFTDPSEAFLLWIKIAALTGVLISSPYLMWQVWLFIAPGLYANEKKLAIPFVICSSGLFVGGAAFSHYVVFPFAWKFFASFSNDFLEFMPRVEPVFSLYVKLLLGMGLVFQMPVLMFVLGRMGVVNAKFLVKNVKYAVLLIFIAAAVITPDGNPVNQVMVAAPMFGLYLMGIGVVWLFGRPAQKREEGETEA
jgi:sec-independent protein translocase protein TatC